MSRRGKVRRSWAGGIASAFLTSALAVVINLATEWKYDLVAWVAVVVLTVLAAVASFLLTPGSARSAPANDLSFGKHLRAGRIHVRGRTNQVEVGDHADIEDFDAAADGDSYHRE